MTTKPKSSTMVSAMRRTVGLGSIVALIRLAARSTMRLSALGWNCLVFWPRYSVVDKGKFLPTLDTDRYCYTVSFGGDRRNNVRRIISLIIK